MSIIDTLITDRTQADVDRVLALSAKGWAGMSAEERAEWSAGLKGAYNAGDLNRVQAAVEYLAGVFESYGYTVNLQATPTWAIGEIPTEAQMGVYLANASVLRAVLDMPSTTPAIPTDMALLTYIEANNIEQILTDIDQLLTNAAAAWYYSGDLFSGEVT